MQERRAVHRDRTYLGGQIAYNRRSSTMDCVVRNMSQDGAKIVLHNPGLIPSEVDILIPLRGESRRAQVIWRDEKQAGVVFLQNEESTVVSIEFARRLKKVKAERDALAARVAQLTEHT